MINITNNKLYPPYIEGNLPAFCTEIVEVGADKTEEHIVLYLQFTMNKGVSLSQIKGYSLQVKKITTNQIIATYDDQNKITKLDDLNIIRFDLGKKNSSSQKLVPGQYYKFQLAFKSQGDITGFYSTPGVARYIAKPEIKILNFDSEAMRAQGLYEPLTSGEYLYSYSFKLYKGEPDLLVEIVEDSGEIIFNASNVDENNNATLTYNFNYQPVYGQRYYVKFEIKTGNAYLTSTISTPTLALPSIEPTSKFKLEANNNYDNGYIGVAIKPSDDEPTKLATGGFRLGRRSSKDNFKSYEEILDFELLNELPDKFLYKDYFIEHGVEYQYAYLQYNTAYKNKTEGAIISKRIWSNSAEAKFEDLFLSDGEIQFKVRYNPKVTSIKTTLLEAKIDTLGGQYPFIFRNGSVKYHEFPISGLISYLEDDEEIFMKRPAGFLPTTNLTDDNMLMERNFKFKVMDWLNNGEVKYFKSPAEGSYLIRLMNVSLTPNDLLSRMLHTFNATAYEVGDINRTNLEKYKFILPNKLIPSSNVVSIKQEEITGGQTLELSNIINLEFFVNQTNTNISINSKYEDKMGSGTSIIINNNSNNSEKIFIPNYILNYSLNVEYDIVYITAENKSITVVYTQKNTATPADSEFENILSVNKGIESNLQIRQIDGTKPYLDGTEPDSGNGAVPYLDVKKYLLKDDSEQIAFFSFLLFYKNPDIEKAMEWDKNNFKIEINGTIIDLKDTRSYLLKNIDYIISLKISPGIMLECGYYINHIKKKGEL